MTANHKHENNRLNLCRSSPLEGAGDGGGQGTTLGPRNATASVTLPLTVEDHMRTQPTSMVRGAGELTGGRKEVEDKGDGRWEMNSNNKQ